MPLQVANEDPRDLVMMLMEGLREASTCYKNPTTFKRAILRVATVAVAGLEWATVHESQSVKPVEKRIITP